MTLRLHLAEATTGPPLPLSPAQVATLATVPLLVTMTPTAGGRWRLAGRQRVGTVRLGHNDGAIELRIQPKLPVRRLLGLLGDNDDIWQHRQITAATDDLLVPALATVFARAAERVLRGGVLHGYVHREDALTVVRGRIRTSAQLSRRMGLPTAIEVAYDDYLADIPENQILLGAIELAQTLPDIAETTITLLRHLSGRLVGVVPVRPGAPLPPWRPTQLNERYAPALKLAELILSGASLQQEGSRAIKIDGFVMNMAKIFERFLTRQLAAGLSPHNFRCVAQQGHQLDQQLRVLFQPDILICRDGRPFVVVDAKYRTLDGAPPTEHLFQLISYCTALGLTEGHLVYASGTPSAQPYRIKNSDISVHAHVLDLGQRPADLASAVAALADRLTARSEGPDMATALLPGTHEE
ncbi:McrBC 5-methylcytosine restriction system component [Nonomuraea monospora]|uniref:McrBC 5-methylcytosine restriction system component n=1 Tax=Nonomuraea monospora TaxID=568818 RepID=A0ABN3CF48_9ACTN